MGRAWVSVLLGVVVWGNHGAAKIASLNASVGNDVYDGYFALIVYGYMSN